MLFIGGSESEEDSISFDPAPVLKAAGISLPAGELLDVSYVYKNNKNASAGVTKESKKSYYYIRLKIKKGASKLTGDKAKYSALKKIVAAVNKKLKTKENRCYFTINKASMSDVSPKVYLKNSTVAVDKKGR